MTGIALSGVLVVRPEPGSTRTLARLHALGVDAAAFPLFATVPVPWDAPDPAAHDALLITSANAVRHAGPTLAALAHLPVIAVGAQTAEAARGAGLSAAAGDGWAPALTADTPTDAALCRVGAAACTPAIDPAAGAGDKAP